MAIKPEGKKNKVLPIFFLVDVSGTMKGERIKAVNVAMKDVVTLMKDEIDKENQDIDYTLRVLTFGRGGAMFRYGTKEKGIPLSEYNWTEISDNECDGYTPMGECIDLVRDLFEDGNYQEYLGKRLATPFVLLISDGRPNGDVDVEEVSQKLFETKIGQMSIFVSIGISVEDDEVAKNVLQTFGTNGFASGDGSKPEELAKLIEQVTTESIIIASNPTGDARDKKIPVSDILY